MRPPRTWRPPLRREAIDASSVKECPSASMDTRAPPPASSFTASPTSSSPVASDRLGRSLLFSLGELLRVDADREFGLTAELDRGGCRCWYHLCDGSRAFRAAGAGHRQQRRRRSGWPWTGCEVIVNGRRREPAAEQVRRIEPTGGHASAISPSPATRSGSSPRRWRMRLTFWSPALARFEHRFAEATREDWMRSLQCLVGGRLCPRADPGRRRRR